MGVCLCSTPVPVACSVHKLLPNVLAGLENSTLPQAKDTNVATMMPRGEPLVQLLQRHWKLQEPWTFVVAPNYHINATWSWYSPLGHYPACCRSKTTLGSQHLQQYCN